MVFAIECQCQLFLFWAVFAVAFLELGFEAIEHH